MGLCVRNVTIVGKVLNFDGLHGGTYNVHFDDVDDACRQGDRKGTKPAVAGQVTISQATGKGSFDTTPLALTTGTKHIVRFVHPQTGHVTLNSTFIAG